MHLADFDYDLPTELIAQYPTVERTGSRLLRLAVDELQHRTFDDLRSLVRAGDLLVLNNTRVLKARLLAMKDSGGRAELMLERVVDERDALFQVRVSKPLKPGRRLNIDGDSLSCVDRQGEFYLLRADIPILQLLDRHGHVPLPPYIARCDDAQFDAERYQTVYGRVPGAVAAPTAGLHFSEAMLADLRAAGVELAEVTLHVGAGTFQPVRGDLDEHEMHEEWYEISSTAAAQIRHCRARGGRLIAVGTTVVRTLEDAALRGQGEVLAGSARTRLFIRPGFDFQVIDALVTNFHLPKSTLLMLVCAFAGFDRVMNAYREAVQKQYRFFSYGDAMLIERNDV